MTLLPANATKYERALEKTCARSFDLPVLINTLRNPWECPLSVLPWLAYEWSVDEWNESWTEQQKRATVAASIAVHKKKGTRGAVEDALNALDVDVLAAEWWEFEPQHQPGTFELLVNSDMQTTDAFNEILRTVNAAKNTRSHLTAIAVPQSNAATIAIAGRASTGISLGGAMPHTIDASKAPLQMGGVGTASITLSGCLPKFENGRGKTALNDVAVARMLVGCTGQISHTATTTQITLQSGGVGLLLAPVTASMEA